jgi:tetratricopeptide (TPR) repeat protein
MRCAGCGKNSCTLKLSPVASVKSYFIACLRLISDNRRMLFRHPHLCSLLLVCLIGLAPLASAQSLLCPDLSAFYDQPQTDWELVEQQLTPLQARCLLSSEYFALLRAAQLNGGRLTQALESLERALLLMPNNGAAQIDYAHALYLQGQLFSALEMNRQIIARTDLPPHLTPMLNRRQQEWQALTRPVCAAGRSAGWL